MMTSSILKAARAVAFEHVSVTPLYFKGLKNVK
jgi:hypothetical protein